MQLRELVRDPLFQLNLLLWMAKEQPPDAFIVKPLFYEAGFRLVYVQQPFPFPQETISAIEASGLDVAKRPEPEVLLKRSADRRALYFEAKAESFSTESTTARQARGHLLATGEAFVEVFGPVLKSCLLCYVLPEERRELMAECLAELTGQMTERKMSIGQWSVHGLDLRNDELVYCWDAHSKQYLGVDDDFAVVMAALSEDTDPSPLFLVYSVEDYPDPENQDLLRRALINQVHALLVCALNALPPTADYRITTHAILTEMSDGVYDYLGRHRQKQMRRLVQQNVFRRIADFAKERFADIVTLEGGVLHIRFATEEKKASFLDWLEDFNRTSFSSKNPEHDPQLTFPGFADDDS